MNWANRVPKRGWPEEDHSVQALGFMERTKPDYLRSATAACPDCQAVHFEITHSFELCRRDGLARDNDDQAADIVQVGRMALEDLAAAELVWRRQQRS